MLLFLVSSITYASEIREITMSFSHKKETYASDFHLYISPFQYNKFFQNGSNPEPLKLQAAVFYITAAYFPAGLQAVYRCLLFLR